MPINNSKGVNVFMKTEISLLMALLVVGTSLLIRGTAQGIDRALVALTLEAGRKVVRAGRQILPDNMRWGW